MSQVLVRDVDASIIERVKRRARQNGRSLEAELRMILQQAAGEPRPEILSRVERVRALFQGRSFSDSTELIREVRER